MNTINKKLSLGQSLFSEEIRISYKGPVDGKIITFLADYIYVINELSEKATRKIFKIFFELAENISKYSADKIKLKDGTEAYRTDIEWLMKGNRSLITNGTIML